MDLINKPDDDDLPLPVPWEDRPISYARWRKHRDTIMQWAHPGKRPPEWWTYEKKKRRPVEHETSTLFKMGELTKGELAELMPDWLAQYEKATAPGFAYCVGQHPGTTGALWIEGTEAREAYFRWADIPPDLIRKWNADRRRSSPIVRKLAKGAGAT